MLSVFILLYHLPLRTNFQTIFIDIAIKIVQKYPELGRSNPLLGLLARKPEAFSEKKSNMIGRSIKLGGYIYSSMFTTHQPSEIQQSEPQSGSVPKHPAQHVASPNSEPHSGTVPKDSASPNTKSNIIGRAFKSGKYLYLHIGF